MDDNLHIAEIPYESGAIRYRYSRFLSADGTTWIRDGLFVEYHEDGAVKSEGAYANGNEQGVWRHYYENGQLAVEGQYIEGKEDGVWRFWNPSGAPEASVIYRNGKEVA